LDNLGLEFYFWCIGARSNILLGAFPREMTGLSASVALALALEVVDVLDPALWSPPFFELVLLVFLDFSSIKVFMISDFIS
jgi:hypothetical protein